MLNANHDLDDVIRRSTQVDVPAEVKERMQHQLAGLRERIQQRPSSRLGDYVETWTRLLSLRVTAIAVAALAVATALILIPTGSKANRVYAAAITQLRDAQSLEYKVVLAPDTEVSFSYLAPAYRRVKFSWGTEIRSDGSGRELVLMHLAGSYVMEEGKQSDALAESTDLVNGLKSLPKTADQFLGTKEIEGRRLTGYRILHLPEGTVSRGFRSMDLWVDAATGDPDHADIAIQEEGKYKENTDDMVTTNTLHDLLQRYDLNLVYDRLNDYKDVKNINVQLLMQSMCRQRRNHSKKPQQAAVTRTAKAFLSIT